MASRGNGPCPGERTYLRLVRRQKAEGRLCITKTTRGWILIKMNDELADASKDILIAEPRSVLSGRTIEEVF